MNHACNSTSSRHTIYEAQKRNHDNIGQTRVCVYLFAGAAPAADGTEDSELLKILTPELGSAAGTASRMRILTHQVQEAELQSSAAEMQVSCMCTIHLANSWKS
jgi:hypothetical protein